MVFNPNNAIDYDSYFIQTNIIPRISITSNYYDTINFIEQPLITGIKAEYFNGDLSKYSNIDLTIQFLNNEILTKIVTLYCYK